MSSIQQQQQERHLNRGQLYYRMASQSPRATQPGAKSHGFGGPMISCQQLFFSEELCFKREIFYDI